MTKPLGYWQFKNGSIADIIDPVFWLMRLAAGCKPAHRAWDHGLGAYVYYDA